MLTYIPSPPTGEWFLGPVPIRAYALCILVGIALAYWLSVRRWRARGGSTETLETVLMWAIPFGIIGARLYHVITDYQLYFGPGRDPIRALYIWEGGLGIWGAVAFGALGAWIGCRVSGAKFLSVADTVAPGLLIAQAIGRLGNWFNQELFGRPTEVPWALMIDPQHRPAGFEQFSTFHPTFLYEMLWNLAIAAVLLWADRRYRLGHGKLFALYIALYSLGRFFIESVRIDTVNEIAGFRLNNWTSAITFVCGLLWFLWLLRNRPGREASVERSDDDSPASDSEAAADGDSSTDQASADDSDKDQASSDQDSTDQASTDQASPGQTSTDRKTDVAGSASPDSATADSASADSVSPDSVSQTSADQVAEAADPPAAGAGESAPTSEVGDSVDGADRGSATAANDGAIDVAKDR